jgi:predicted ester cyclase
LTTRDNLAKVTAGLTAVNKRDIDRVVQLIEPDFKLHLILKPEQLLPQGQLSGRDGFATYLAMLYKAFSDMRFEQENLNANGNMVYQQLRVIGTHTGPLVLPTGIELQATRLKVRMPAEVFHTFNSEGGFVSSTGYANVIDIMQQFKN